MNGVGGGPIGVVVGYAVAGNVGVTVGPPGVTVGIGVRLGPTGVADGIGVVGTRGVGDGTSVPEPVVTVTGAVSSVPGSRALYA